MTEKKIIVSACLAGVHCRYDGDHKSRIDIVELVKKGKAIPLCPEQLGGLPTPRPPAEIQSDKKVITNKGIDVTSEYEAGACEALKLTELIGATEALLKSKSPMCGCDEVYDGSYSGKTKKGDGIFTQKLKSLGIKVTPID